MSTKAGWFGEKWLPIGWPISRIGAFDERFAVDRVHQRAAHAHVVERLFRIVHSGDGLALGVSCDGGEARILLHLGKEFGRTDVRERVDVAGAKRRHLRLRIVDEAERDAVELDLVLLPVVGIAHEFDAIAARP